jgi:DNA-binding transcriptional ArsR family regulator
MEDFCNEAYYLFFSALASRTRLAIFDVLRDGSKTVSEISIALRQEQALIFSNLNQLEKIALVLPEGSGKQKRYALNKEIVEPLFHLLAFHISKHCPGLKECIPQERLREYMKKEAAKETYIEHE